MPCRRETIGQEMSGDVPYVFHPPREEFLREERGYGGKGGSFLQEAWQLKKHFFEGASYLDLFKFFCDFKRLSRKT